MPEIQTIQTRLDEIKTIMDQSFPMSASQVIAFREHLRDHVLRLHDQELAAISQLQAVMTA